MKKIQIILSVTVLLVTLSGCGNQKVSSNDGKADNNTTVTESTNDKKKEDTTVSNADVKEKNSDTKKNNTNTNANKTENSTTKDSENATNYEIAEETYTKQNIKITYPRIKNLNDSKKCDLINKTIKDQALAVTNYYDLSNTNAILNVTYHIQFQNIDTLSIVYKGDFNSGSSAYPVSVFYTTNINIKEGKSILLKNYANVNEIFNKLRKSNEVLNLAATQELAQAQKEYLSTIDDSALKDMLSNADFSESNENIQFPTAFSYRKSDNIVIGISVPHAIGDYAEFVVTK